MSTKTKQNIFKGEFIKILAISFSLFLVLYGIFALFYNQIHFANPADLKTILWWHQNEISNDGVELYVMTLLGFLYIISSFFLFKKLPAKSKFYTPLFFVSGIISLFIFLRTGTNVFGLTTSGGFLMVWLLIILAICWLIYALTKKRLNQTLIAVVFLAIFGFVALLSLDIPSFYDWGYYIGPALKLMQGESLKAFFFQYDLSGVLLFWLMMQAKLQIYQMQVILWGVLIGWFYLYYLLARKLVKSSWLILLFLFSLMILRFFAINFGDPVATPSVLPLRLDLWVPLLLLLLSFGFSSFWVSLAFSLGMLANHLFGLFYLALYLLFLVIKIFMKQLKISQFLKLCIAPALAFIVYFAIFGSFLSAGEKLYQSLQFTFVPISLNSPFWIIWAFLPTEIYLLTRDRKNIKELLINLFILGILNLQLVYFYGRSHDHNLLNLSGIWLFVLFFSLSKVSAKYKKQIFITATCFIFFLAFLSSKETQIKMGKAGEKLSQGKIVQISALEQSIDRNPERIKNIQRDKTILVDDIDSFLNYKLGLKQIGYYTPFFNNIFVAPTSQFLLDQISKGMTVEVFDPQMIAQTISQLNGDNLMKNNHLQFYLSPNKGLYQILVADTSKNQVQNQSDNAGIYTFNNISFSSQSLKITRMDENTIQIGDATGVVSIKMIVILPKPVDLQGYLATQKGNGGLKEQGITKILDYSVFVQTWQNNGNPESHFFLVKNDALVQIVLNSEDQQTINAFNNLLKTMK